MVKFSVIVPVYNVEKYLDGCLQSILNQTYQNYEVIIVNDGSVDGSQFIIDKYVNLDKRFKTFIKENTGVSDTRNFGVKKATGDYFIFIDSDDTINQDLLDELNKEIEQNKEVDLIKYQIQVISGSNNKCNETELFSNLDGESAFARLLLNDLFVTPVTYAYRRKFWLLNNFSYAKGRIHEDYGLTPYVVIKAKNVSAISYIGYNYFIRENSIMTDNSKEKLLKKNKDCLYHFDKLINMIRLDESISNDSKKLFNSYMANGLINRTVLLKGKLLKEYMKEIKVRNLYNYLIDDTIMRKLKKIFFRLFPRIYIKFFIK